MRRLVHLLPDLGPHDHAEQVALLAPRLPSDRFSVHVITFRAADFWRGPLQAADIPVLVLGPKSSFLPSLWIRLRRELHQLRPDIIHAWGWEALRLAGVATLGQRPTILASGTELAPQTGCFDRWCQQQAQWVVMPTGSPHERVTVIPYSVAAPVPQDRTMARARLNVPAAAPVFLYAGALAPQHGWREALMLFDLLAHVYHDAWLLVAGGGPDADAMTEFAQKLGLKQVRQLGWQHDPAAVAAAADAAFVLGTLGSPTVALNAVANGLPVVAWRRPDLVELLGTAAAICARDDFQSAAMAVRRVVEEPDWRREVIARGQKHATQFRPEQIVPQWIDVYEQRCGTSPNSQV